MLDGTRLRQSWYEALENAQTTFRQHLTSHSAPEWKRVNVEGSQSSVKGKGRASAEPHLTDVLLHRKVVKGEPVYRAVLDVSAADEATSTLEACKAVLATPELRKEWDTAVERAQLLEMFDQATRISKTNFTLGWPASPRDAVTISRTFNDATTLIDISTSLPRSPDEPTYLRPSPPYVRSQVGLFAWCIQQVQQANGTSRLRFTCFWQHDLRALWNFGTTFSFGQQLCAMMVGFYKTVKTRGPRIPLLTGYGNGVSVERVRFQVDREALTVDYSIVPEDDDHSKQTHALPGEQGLEELSAIREHRRLTRSVEWALPSGEGWDVQVTTKASCDQVAHLPWTAHAFRDKSSLSTNKNKDKVVLSVKHASLPNDHSVLKVRVVIEVSGPSSGWRLNGIPQSIEEVEERDPSYFMSKSILQDTTSLADVSFRSQSTQNTSTTIGTSSTSTIPEPPPIAKVTTERPAAAERSILSRVKRNYIYFSSLLQEPEAKWKRTTEAKGVSVAQLDSIDPTLVVYRAEATFVGLGLWDLYAAISTPSARVFWDKLYDDAAFLEDVNQLTELWHHKSKPAWPVNGRDAVVLKTVYKSPTTIHVFSFSADDPNLFPMIPPVDPNVIRTQVDLQGWAIEALSPTTTLVTLLEQSDPKGWSNKGSIPQQMISSVAGIGEFAIKCGGPPIVTRLEGAKANDMRYDHDKGSFRIEYEGSPSRTSSANSETNNEMPSTPTPMVECELRCDLDNWATSLDIVIDPPPQAIVALRRHRLSSAGGGLWLTITHDAIHAGDERLQVIVRRSPQGVAKEKGLVMVNGAKVEVDVEELLDKEMKNLAKQKRIKPIRIPLDQPPVMGVIRRRKAEWDADESNTADDGTSSSAPASPEQLSTSTPAFATALTKYWSYAVEQATTTTQQAVAAVTPAIAAGADATPSASKPPMQYALEALSYLQGLHSRPASDSWTLAAGSGFPVYRKVEPEISAVIPVHKAEKVIEGVSADEIANVLASYESRKQWDTRFDSAKVFESFGSLSYTAFAVHRAGFPFRDRGFYLANLLAQANLPRRPGGDPEHASDNRTAIFLVSASFSPESVESFAQTKYNPQQLPVGRVFVDGWILETLDPYSSENYAIPSTRCTRVVAVDYAGSIPAAVNSSVNASLPRSIIQLESYLKNISPPPFTRIPPSGLLISSKTESDSSEDSWIVRRRDKDRILVAAKFTPAERSYRSTLMLDTSRRRSESPTLNMAERTPRPSSMTVRPQTPSRVDGATPGSEPESPSAFAPRSPPATRRSDSRDMRSSSMFTVRGEVKYPTDLLVGELVVDTKLYPAGYAVVLRSRIDKGKQSLSLSSLGEDQVSANALPISVAAFTMPPSPLLSSGLNTDRPPCHLLRLTLPTAQYQVSTIQDPLTGETRSAPPKPQWVLDLEDGRAVISVEVKPAALPSAEKKDKLDSITVDGKEVAVLSEKESLTSIGRDELLDGRTSKMDLLVRTASNEAVPPELQSPIAVTTHLLDKAPSPATDASTDDSTVGQAADTPPATSLESDEKVPLVMTASHDGAAADGASSGLLRFLNSYPNPLTRFTAPSRPLLRSLSGSTTVSVQSSKPPGALPELSSPSVATLSAPRENVPAYPLSTVLIAALIAFLIGSLLRSMLSPADFVYVVSDPSDVGDVSSGWREIRRLFELKYIVGGWDFQVALVRRH
ncbi:uncharacterized protein PHACADRAFT_213599 [Phanerochaete carnosa HHB-10118-sp]|uniref:START domain-containing protein n=1 Tax=Phanerochaete carnosa (strain HHB-10118-sp) TaxID=650164 RepID=K5VV70_PHACS|nr:uncharacterized protein PHACADRAFT_213599 [Phanerochaete carnosa HHB-10118-sp]EKM50705.1 hypothetical protein PHACADRAFT_213599 [Phanerochaete carnosa HHB-10118-sp]